MAAAAAEGTGAVLALAGQVAAAWAAVDEGGAASETVGVVWEVGKKIDRQEVVLMAPEHLARAMAGAMAGVAVVVARLPASQVGSSDQVALVQAITGMVMVVVAPAATKIAS